jgi:hypothetical protein
VCTNPQDLKYENKASNYLTHIVTSSEDQTCRIFKYDDKKEENKI